MPGIRLQHPTRRNCRYLVVEPIPYKEPFQCPPPQLGGCGRTHIWKTYHLNLDETGSVVVSTGVYERIKSVVHRDGFVLANEVTEPPTVVAGLASPNLQFHVDIVEGGTPDG